MRNRVVVLFVVTGLCSVLIGCNSKPRQTETQRPPSAETPSAQVQRYDLRGKIVSVDKANKKLTVDHEAIPGFMGAMTMAYPVKDAHLLESLSQGEQVTAKVVSAGSEYWLEDIAAAKPSQ